MQLPDENRPTDEKIQATIEEQRPQWHRTENDFYVMSEGGIEDVRAQYYPGWKGEDFQRVIDALDRVIDALDDSRTRATPFDPDPDSGLKAGEEDLGVGTLTAEQTEVAREAIKNALCFGSGPVSFIRRAFEMYDLPRLTDAQLDVEILQLVQEQDGLS